jgi:hypothetical protein
MAKTPNARLSAMRVFIAALLVACLWADTGFSLEVRLGRDRLSLKADNVPLQTILQGLADKGVRVQCDPAINPLVSASFDNRDLRTGIEDLLKPLGNALIWESVTGPAGPILRLAEIQVFQDGRRQWMQPLKPGRTIVTGSKQGPFWVKGEILLRFKPAVGRQTIEDLLAAIDATVIEANAQLGIYRLIVASETDIQALVGQLSGSGLVAAAEPHFAFPLWPGFAASASLMIPETALTAASAVAGPAIAVLDTGVAPTPDMTGVIAASLNALDPSQSAADTNGHGTRMALVASGLATPLGVGPERTVGLAPVLAVKTMDDNGYTTSFDIIRAIDFAESNGARVLSLSWGSATPSLFLEQALGQAATKGMVIVAAAGNEPSGKAVYPAAYSFVLGVGALAPDGSRWDRSNYGDFVALAAPGWVSIQESVGPAGIYAGTSVATAYVANQTALYLASHPGAGKDEVATWLKEKLKNK